MNILFMGTPEFAVSSLQVLAKSRHRLLGVVTAPDKPSGRGLKISYPPVKKAALKYGIPVFQPTVLNNPDFIREIQKLQAELFVVVAFRILPAEIFELPPKGTINLHASLLPKYRGAAPINWAIINGETKTGVTTIFIEKKVDAGDIILQKETEIHKDETAGELHDKLARMGAEVLLETIDLIASGKAIRKLQTGEATRAPKISRELGNIDWGKSSLAIHNLVRGLNPTPGAYTFLNGRLLKIFKTKLLENSALYAAPGEFVAVAPRAGLLTVACGSGSLQLQELQPEGKRKMSTRDFLLGNPAKVGDRLRREPTNFYG